MSLRTPPPPPPRHAPRVTYQRLVGDDGKKVRSPPTATLHERAHFVEDGDKGWLLLRAEALGEAAAAAAGEQQQQQQAPAAAG